MREEEKGYGGGRGTGRGRGIGRERGLGGVRKGMGGGHQKEWWQRGSIDIGCMGFIAGKRRVC